LHNEPTIYIPLTLLAAFGFAAAAVLQQDQAAKLPQGHARSSPILVQLLSRPLWLAGLLAYLVAYALQMVAVSLGPVVVIQPLISAQLVFALLLGVVFLHREATVREWLGAVAVTIGIAVFIVATDPSPGNPDASGRGWMVSSGAIGGLMTIAVVLGWRTTGPARSTWYGAASGLAWA
jgi:drug/metabolite transporter (DMT)-like permease